MTKSLPNNLVGIIGIVVCSFNLTMDELSIWQGGTNIRSIALLVPICRYLAQTMTTGGSDWRIVMECLYAITWFLHYAIFALAFWECNKISVKPDRRKLAALLTVQAAVALLSDGHYLLGAVAAQFAYHLPLRQALQCSLALLALSWLSWLPSQFSLTGYSSPSAIDRWYFPLSDLRDQVIYFSMGYITFIAIRNRDRLTAANAKLLATQQLLGQTVRSSERVRIARELHDSIGHHLTALNLHLDLAVRQSGPNVSPSVHTAQELGRQLLANMRVTVSNERREPMIDLGQALQTLCSGIPQPHIVLIIDPGFEVDNPAIAHTLFCCAQEAITNTIRHANATTMEISLKRTDSEIALTIEDDGQGLGSTTEGNGLRGMRERISEHIGSMIIGNRRDGNGCLIDIRMPLARTYS